MNELVSDFITNRIEEIQQNLRKTNGEYALALKSNQALLVEIGYILRHKGDLIISEGDCTNFRHFLDNDCIANAIMQQELYKQGYLDCIQLLGMLKLR